MTKDHAQDGSSAAIAEGRRDDVRRLVHACPVEAARSPARVLEVAPDGRTLTARMITSRMLADDGRLSSSDVDLFFDFGSPTHGAFQRAARILSADTPQAAGVTCVLGLERTTGVALETALTCLGLMSGEWLVVALATSPLPPSDTSRRTVLHLDGWGALLAAAGWEEVSRQAPTSTESTRAAAVPAHWTRSNPFRDGAHGDPWTVVLRRSSTTLARRRDAAALRQAIAAALTPFGLDVRTPLDLDQRSRISDASRSRIAFLIGSVQDYNQLLPLIDALPASRRLTIVRRGFGAPLAMGRRDAVGARLARRGNDPLRAAVLADVPWDTIGTLVTAAESTANSEHLLNAAFVIAARARGIRTCQLQHGIVPLVDPSGPAIWFSELYFGWGQDVRRLLALTAAERAQRRRLFHAADRLRYVATGCPKFDAYARDTRLRAADLFGRWADCFERTILVATNLHWTQHRTGPAVWPALAALAAARPRDLFVLKLHPAEEPPADWPAGLPDNMIVLDEHSALDAGFDSIRLVQACDALVCTLSTIALEAALAGRPFVMLDTGNPNRYRGVPAIARDDLPQALTRALRRPSPTRTFTQAYLDSRTVGSATTRALAILTAPIAASARRRVSMPATWRAYTSFADTLSIRDGQAGELHAVGIEQDRYITALRDTVEAQRDHEQILVAELQARDRRFASLRDELAPAPALAAPPANQEVASDAVIPGHGRGPADGRARSTRRSGVAAVKPDQPMRVGLFGGGSRGLQVLASFKDDPRIAIECFFDNDPKKWGTSLEGLPIRQPSAVNCEALDVIVIASVYAREIFVQLAGLGCAARVALSPADLVRRLSGGGRDLVFAPADPEANQRLRAALIAQAPRHIAALADRIDSDPGPVPPRGPAWTDETACTICCNNYVAYALTLARSFLRHHPGGRFFIGLCDTRTSAVAYPSDPRIQLVEAWSLPIPQFEAYAFKYDVLELNTAIKPYLLEYLFRQQGVRRLLYLDPDILVLEPLHDLFAQLAGVPMVLTPHLTRPYDDDRHPQEVDIMRAGTFNLGFIGLAAHAQTGDFLRWWQQRLYDGCTRDVEKGYFTDQKWIDFVPSFFPEHRVLREPGYNAAYWNLHERAVTFDEGRFRANGCPLYFFHFSGIEILDLNSVSKHQNRHTLPAAGPLRDLYELYRALLVRHGHVEMRGLPYTYGRFDNGIRVPDIVRRIYRECALTGAFPQPFTAAATPSFYDWLRAPARPGFLLSNLLATMHARLPDLRAAYPDLYGASMAGFLLYMLSASELYGLPPELGVVDLASVGEHLARAKAASDPPGAAARDAASASMEHAPAADARFVATTGDSPSALMADALAGALERATTGVRSAESAAARSQTFIVGPVRTLLARVDVEPIAEAIGYWCWDERWDPQAIAAALRQAARRRRGALREIWVPSTYALEGLARLAPVPVVRLPPPVGVIEPAAASCATFGLAADRFTFLSMMDAPDPDGADDLLRTVDAFRLAREASSFATRARLVLAVTPNVLSSEGRRALRERCAGIDAIQILERPLSGSDSVALLRLANSYVSLRAVRAFDLWLAYALWHGRPAIAVAHGGALDCASVNNSLLVDLVGGRGTDDTSEAAHAAPRVMVADVSHAAALMQRAVASPDEMRWRGARACADARARYATEVVTTTIRQRLTLFDLARRRAAGEPVNAGHSPSPQASDVPKTTVEAAGP